MAAEPFDVAQPRYSVPATSEHQSAEASRQSLETCNASLPSWPSWLSKIYLKSDHFSGGWIITRASTAKVDDKLTTHLFKTGTLGFCAPEDSSVAVCVLPGTELSFTDDVRRLRPWPCSKGMIKHRTAIFRQVNSIKKSFAPIMTPSNSRIGRSCF